ncbi:MAG: L-threonylcarbamoyladenylate synthase [Rhodothalassiaceae bacterium]
MSTTRILPPDATAIARAAEILRAGGLVALPTETVYGLAADATNATAVAAIFAAKGRPRFNPLICHVPDVAAATALVEAGPLAARLMAAFWPGPLTLVLPRRAAAPVAALVSAGLDTLAVRAPAHPVARGLLEAFGGPLAAPSANRSGRVSPTTAQHVAADLGDAVDLILDGGPCAVGIESTIIAVDGDRVTLLRPGGIAEEEIARLIGGPLARGAQGSVRAPGMLRSHYAPKAPVRLDATERRTGEVLIGFGPIAGDLSLSPAGDLVEAAARLFAVLREADARRPRAIAMAPIPDVGLGRAINDRLQRAAAAREGDSP